MPNQTKVFLCLINIWHGISFKDAAKRIPVNFFNYLEINAFIYCFFNKKTELKLTIMTLVSYYYEGIHSRLTTSVSSIIDLPVLFLFYLFVFPFSKIKKLKSLSFIERCPVSTSFIFNKISSKYFSFSDVFPLFFHVASSSVVQSSFIHNI